MRVHIAGDVAGGGAARCAAETLPRLLLQLLLGQAVRSVPRPVCLGAVEVAPLLPPALPWHDRLRARPAACPGLAGMLMMACAVHGSLLTLQNFRAGLWSRRPAYQSLDAIAPLQLHCPLSSLSSSSCSEGSFMPFASFSCA